VASEIIIYAVVGSPRNDFTNNNHEGQGYGSFHHSRVVCLAANIIGEVIASMIDGISPMMSKILRTKTVVFIGFG
jgi:hypothetical protein